MIISDAVGQERLSKVVGYKIAKGNFSNSTPNLPQRIVVLAEANTANQSGLLLSAQNITTSQQAGQLYGFGSPMHRIFEILRPSNGSSIVGGIPTIALAQAAAGGGAAKVITFTATGTATGNGTHTVVINGRRSMNGIPYDINIVSGDTPTAIAAKAVALITGVLGSPVLPVATAGAVACTSKWAGLTSNDNNISIDTNGTSLGVTWAVVDTTAGSGTPSVQAALDQFGNDWNTIIVNSYGAVTTVMDALEAFNGIPDPTTPTGRYNALITKPFIALTGSTLADPSSITDARKLNVTIAICPAPLSKGLPMEAAANMACLFSRCAQDTPELDVSGSYYPDMPVPADGQIGAMATYDSRDVILKKGCSTVSLVSGTYQVFDFVTTYHPVGENPAQFSYCRNLNLDWNVRFGYYLLEQIYVVDHLLASDSDVVNTNKVVKPKTWKANVKAYAVDLGERGLISEVEFMQDSVITGLSSTNPGRLETAFSYKRSSTVRIASTTATAGFNFGN